MFKKYLANKGLIRQFNHNLVTHYLDGNEPNPNASGWFELYATNPSAISSAFTWASTPEGGDFWSNLNRLWYKYLESNK